METDRRKILVRCRRISLEELRDNYETRRGLACKDICTCFEIIDITIIIVIMSILIMTFMLFDMIRLRLRSLPDVVLPSSEDSALVNRTKDMKHESDARDTTFVSTWISEDSKLEPTGTALSQVAKLLMALVGILAPHLSPFKGH